ncbi:hypothetical protein KI387_013761, partial [Taxus chinensis]
LGWGSSVAPKPRAHNGWSLSPLSDKFSIMALAISPTRDNTEDNEEEGHVGSSWEVSNIGKDIPGFGWPDTEDNEEEGHVGSIG